MSFRTAVKEDTPRLVVLFKRDDQGQEQFQWGVVGEIPLLSLIGFVERAIIELTVGPLEGCDEPAFVIAWDKEKGSMSCWKHPDIPLDPLLGMLVIIRGMLVDSRLAQRAVAQSVQMYGADGKPIRR